MPSRPFHSRREFIKLSLLGAGASCIPYLGAMASPKGNATQIITDHAKRISAQKPTSLQILYPQGSLSNIKVVADLFTKQTGITFKFIETTVNDINTKISIDHASQTNTFDIALPATFGIPELAKAGALEDISAYAHKYEPLINYKKSLYTKGDNHLGKLYGYQTDGDAYLMFYNCDLLEEPDAQKRYEEQFGRPLKSAQTWEDLDQLMAFFHNPEENKYGGCLPRTPDYMAWEWWVRFHAKKQFPFNDDMTPNINNKKGVEALTQLIAASAHQHPSSATNGLFENWEEFAKGQCAVNIGWGGTQKYLKANATPACDNIHFTPTPEASYFNWGWNYVTSSTSKHKELAYLFCLFATIPEQSILAVQQEDGFFDPFRTEHYTSPKIQETYGKPFLAAHEKAMQTAFPDLYIEGQGAYMNALKENIALANDQKISAKEALDFTVKIWEKTTNELGRSHQAEQWKFLKAQYPNQ